jgi:hypothetical protein
MQLAGRWRLALASAITGALLVGLIVAASAAISAADTTTRLEITRVHAETRIPGGDVEAAEATCPPGMHVISGGFSAIGGDATELVAVDRQVNHGTTWRVVAENPGSQAGRVLAYAVCTRTSKTSSGT